MRRSLFIALLLCGLDGPAHATPCAPGASPVINVTTSESQPRFDYSLNQKALEAYQGNTAVYDLTVNAMSTGKLRIKHNVAFANKMMEDKQTCVQVAAVNVHVHLDPIIYIAAELHDDACEYKEYLLHELKHVEEDRRLIGDYKAIVQRNMAFAFPTVAEYSAGPVPPAQADEAEQKFKDNIGGTVRATFDSMLRERRDRQRKIDSTDEYLRLSLVCGEGGAGVKPELRQP